MHQVNAVAGVGRAPPPAAVEVDLALEVDLAVARSLRSIVGF
jgi:hypothetical protein